MIPYEILTKNRAKSAADATWPNLISDNSLEARCCHGNCSARIVKTTKNLLPTMPSFEPPTISFIMENTRSITKALKFINSTMMCLNKSTQKTNLFSTTNLTSNQLLETISNFECFFLSLLTERMPFLAKNESLTSPINDTSLSSGPCSNVGSSTSGLGGGTTYKESTHQSIISPSDHFPKYNEFNFALMLFLFAIDRLQYTEMDEMFEQFCGVSIENVPIIDIADIFIDHWHIMVNIFSSVNKVPLYRGGENEDFVNDNSSSLHSSTSKSSIPCTPKSYHSFRKVTSVSESLNFTLTNEFEILKDRTLKEMTNYKGLHNKLNEKANQMDLHEFIAGMRQSYCCYDQDDNCSLKFDAGNHPLIFSFHNMMNIQCVCHGPSDYHKYTLNFHLEAGRPIDIIRYMAKMRLHYYNDSNCATQIDLFLVTYRQFIPLQDLVDILLGEVYHYFPEQHREPHHLFYANAILLIDVISNIFESGQVLGGFLPQLWRLMYCLILRGRHNLALSLRRSLQHYLTMSNTHNKLTNLNYKVAQNVEQHHQLMDSKGAVKKLLSLSPSDVAAQLTITDEEIFHAINLAEVLYWFHLKYKKSKKSSQSCDSLSSISTYAPIPHINNNNTHKNTITNNDNTNTITNNYNTNTITNNENTNTITNNDIINKNNAHATLSSSTFLPATNSTNSINNQNVTESFAYRKICANMNRSTIRFHFINHWTIKLINSTGKKSKRIKRLEFVFKLLDALFNLGNIHSAFAVYTGMSSSNNTKLITSLLESNKEFYAIWYKLSHMTDITNGHESYRRIVDNLQAPFIPYLGIAMSDINMLMLSMKDNLKESNLFDSTIKSHSLIALTPKNITKLSDEVLFKGIKLPSTSFDERSLDQMINIRKLWRYFNVLRSNITKPRLAHYNISIDKYIQSVILSCDQLQ